jgi:GntR family galactonate operon transcriptional repressor
VSGYPGRGLHGQTVALLGARIVSGGLAPGTVLDLAALGRELDLSMTALREALKVLAAKGLVGARQRRGTFVRDRSEWNLLDGDVLRWRGEAGDTRILLRDLAEVRATVEPAAAGLAALRRDGADLAELEAALIEMADAGDPSAEVAADLRWHRALLAATHNELFAGMDVFLEPALRVRDLLVHAADADDPLPTHSAVVDAIRRADPDAASAAVRALLDKSAHDADATIRPGQERR